MTIAQLSVILDHYKNKGLGDVPVRLYVRDKETDFQAADELVDVMLYQELWQEDGQKLLQLCGPDVE